VILHQLKMLAESDGKIVHNIYDLSDQADLNDCFSEVVWVVHPRQKLANEMRLPT
jgi:hypothetical protein